MSFLDGLLRALERLADPLSLDDRHPAYSSNAEIDEEIWWCEDCPPERCLGTNPRCPAGETSGVGGLV